MPNSYRTKLEVRIGTPLKQRLRTINSLTVPFEQCFGPGFTEFRSPSRFLMTKKLKKFTVEKRTKEFFLSKNAVFLVLYLQKRFQVTGVASSLPQRLSSTSKHEVS
jgi:hypothetical protein